MIFRCFLKARPKKHLCLFPGKKGALILSKMEMSKLGFVLRKKIGSRHLESEIDNQGRIKVLEPKTIETEKTWPRFFYDSCDTKKAWCLDKNKELLKKSEHMGVSKNRGTPKSSILIGFSIINHPFWGTPIFGNIHIELLRSMPQNILLEEMPGETTSCPA